ncbi:translation protein SH3-like protein [Melanomma pulvis-pyrius CBS 109.77]|uniref:Translation protein SH3-like protein n=1 Tax=Melanomma pulvis-pyrius CBS 109.77 TaxID=1314802 RepID=A0A6A6XR96_9PLEO|nr:translation protein SH3-like protein [Melanomma pulvis-pyrius CBS 109.77]
MDNSHESSQQAKTITIPARVFPRNSPVSRFDAESEYVVPTTNVITIPCHHIRIGDILILQNRPCQVIRITTSSQTGQHRYLGVDLFTKALYEESSFISNPAPSVVVQNMLGPVFHQYRVLDIQDDDRVLAMTETGDIKQLSILDQSDLVSRLTKSFDNGKGSVRVLVISDDNLEMIVDYKVVLGRNL